MPKTYIMMKVFSHYPSKKIWQFSKTEGKTTAPSSVSDCVYSTPNDTGVGIVSVYFLSGFARTFFEIDEIGSTLLYWYNPQLKPWGASGRKNENSISKCLS